MTQPASKRLVTEAAASSTYALVAEPIGAAAQTTANAAATQAPAPSGGDDTAALAALLTAGSVRLRPNSTYLATALTVSAGKVLDLFGSTVKRFSGSANLITLSANALVRDGTLDGNTLNGSMVRISAVADATAVNIRAINGGVAYAFDATGSTRPTFTNCSSVSFTAGVILNTGTVDALVTGGSHLSSTSTSTSVGSLYVPNALRSRFVGVLAQSAAGHGIYVGASASDTTFEGCTSRLNGTAGGDWRGATVFGATRTTFARCLFESNIEAGVYSDTTATNLRVMHCTTRDNNVGLRPGGHGIEMLSGGLIIGCHTDGQLGNAANAGCGIYVGGNGGVVSGCRSTSNYSVGIRLVNSVNAQVVGCVAVNNSQRGANLHDGIELNGISVGLCHEVTVSDCQCWDTQGTKTQRYGIAVNANVDYYNLTGNITRGNATGGISDGGGANKSVANNL